MLSLRSPTLASTLAPLQLSTYASETHTRSRRRGPFSLPAPGLSTSQPSPASPRSLGESPGTAAPISHSPPSYCHSLFIAIFLLPILCPLPSYLPFTLIALTSLLILIFILICFMWKFAALKHFFIFPFLGFYFFILHFIFISIFTYIAMAIVAISTFTFVVIFIPISMLTVVAIIIFNLAYLIFAMCALKFNSFISIFILSYSCW